MGIEFKKKKFFFLCGVARKYRAGYVEGNFM